MMDEWLANDVIDVCRINDRSIGVKFVYKREILMMISAYVPQLE